MFLLRAPSPEQVARFLEASSDLPLSDGPKLATSAFGCDELVVTIGHGETDFERAQHALTAWKQFDVGWVRAFPSQPSIEPGTNVAVLIRHLGLWSLNGARVLDRFGGLAEGRFGFTYGTLTNHAETGEELFEIFIDRTSGDVRYRIRAISAAQSPLAWLGFPVVRLLQKRFRRDSALAMQALRRR